MDQTEIEKQAAADHAVQLIQDGMLLGLGSGSTSAYAIRRIGERVRQGLNVRGIPTSRHSEELAEAVGIPLTSFDDETRIDLTIDGADELTPQLQLIKGGGGAMLREKIVATASDRLIIIADSRKLVPALGKFQLPIEVLPFACPVVARWLHELGGKPQLRCDAAGQPIKTDQQNLVLDCDFGIIETPEELADQLDRIPGLIAHGLFLRLASCAIVGRGTEIQTIERATERD
jgi:ribose 5-phosphate isomerase A